MICRCPRAVWPRSWIGPTLALMAKAKRSCGAVAMKRSMSSVMALTFLPVWERLRQGEEAASSCHPRCLMLTRLQTPPPMTGREVRYAAFGLPSR